MRQSTQCLGTAWVHLFHCTCPPCYISFYLGTEIINIEGQCSITEIICISNLLISWWFCKKKRSHKYSILLNEIKAHLGQHFYLMSPNQSKLLSQYNHWKHHLRWLGCWRTIPSVLDLDSSWSGKPFKKKFWAILESESFFWLFLMW